MTDPTETGQTKMSIGEAVRSLAAAQKSSVGAPAYSRFVNRPLGRMIASVAYAIGMTPNGVTVVSAVVTLSGVALIALLAPGPVTGVLVALLLVLGYALDAADGQLARLTGRGSISGEWLDHMADSIKSSALHLAVVISIYRFFDVGHEWALVPLGYTLVSAVFFFGIILTEQLRKAANAGRAPEPHSKATRSSPFYSLAVIPADYGFLCLSFITLAWPPLFLVVYTFLFACNALILAASLVRWYRALGKLSR